MSQGLSVFFQLSCKGLEAFINQLFWFSSTNLIRVWGFFISNQAFQFLSSNSTRVCRFFIEQPFSSFLLPVSTKIKIFFINQLLICSPSLHPLGLKA